MNEPIADAEELGAPAIATTMPTMDPPMLVADAIAEVVSHEAINDEAAIAIEAAITPDADVTPMPKAEKAPNAECQLRRSDPARGAFGEPPVFFFNLEVLS